MVRYRTTAMKKHSIPEMSYSHSMVAGGFEEMS